MPRQLPQLMEMFNAMPVVSVLLFQPDAWPKHPEEPIGDLLAEVHHRKA
ncbi:MAG: hypothetical protein H6672_13575 [Anaerolineaceae bacterium]|nr:hypothetical protein [Anaerolineaceae bacterium]